ncbi:hypothetical protein [Spongiivirga citrea]|uniref:Uncharacterized protein n=1 Tax=Spongiivirga citrea TaxID=1481457 RepID=A0A6M0CF04_9FLAO|nr:hypothetical protein [Spongiivirga citrea]NER16406.1 hypothetical protein [Spongiivirga citrea]
MTNGQKDALFTLIKSLSKSEKRQFKLYVNRLGMNAEAKFLALFNLLEKLKQYDERQILESGIVKKQQLSNLKAHLYKQVLISLRLNPVHQNVRSQLREQLDFATILYHKGLYKQSLKMLDRAKTAAIEHEEKNIAYEVVELEKIIESQYITRSMSNRAEQLVEQAKTISRQNVLTSRLSNLSLQLYGLMLKTGYVKNDEELQVVKKFFSDKLPEYDNDLMGFREKLWLFKAYLWYSFLTQDFLASYRYSKKWVDLFDEYPKMIKLNPVFFLKGHNYLLESLFFIKKQTHFKEVLTKLEKLNESEAFVVDDNIESLLFLYTYSHKINYHFLSGTFNEGIPVVDEVLSGLKKYQSRIDEHHIMVFYYKIACLYFGAGDNRSCIKYLQKIINNRSLKMRQDLMCFARVLNLVAHYDAGIDYNLEMQIRITYKFLLKMDNLQKVQKEMIRFLRSLGDFYPQDLKNEFAKLHATLKEYEDHPYEKRAFLYLDIISWLESKIKGKPVGEIIREKALMLNK